MIPLSGMFSAGLGGIGASATSSLVGVVGVIIGTLPEAGFTDTQPVVDKWFTRFSSIDGFMKQFLQTTTYGFKTAWEH